MSGRSNRWRAMRAEVLQTDRLILRHLTADDAEFVFELVNDPAWLRFIGDRGVRTLDDARDYIRKGPGETSSTTSTSGSRFCRRSAAGDTPGRPLAPR